MLANFGLLIILVILIIAVLALGLLAWFLMQPSKSAPTTANKTDVRTNVTTEPVIQRFISNDLKKRAFIVRENEGGFKVIFQEYSNKVINRGGEVAGWQSSSEKPVTDSLAKAVEIAQSWVHASE